MSAVDFSRSRAILLGTAHYTNGLPEMVAAANSLKAMESLLTGPQCGWPASRVTVLSDMSTADRPDQFVARLIHEATDVLLFYYVGHGQLLNGDQLGMALVDTHVEPTMRRATSFRLDDLRAELTYHCRARLKLVILDCCFSGLATRNAQGVGIADQIQLVTQVEGAYTLTASRAAQKAIHQEGGRGLTYFTKIFTDVVREGIPGKGPMLTLKDIHQEVAERFRALELPPGLMRPEPTKLVVDTAEEFPFAHNRRAVEPSFPTPGIAGPATPAVSPPAPNGRPASRARSIGVAGALIAAAAVGAVGIWGLRAPPPAQPSPSAGRPATLTIPKATDEPFSPGPALAPSGIGQNTTALLRSGNNGMVVDLDGAHTTPGTRIKSQQTNGSVAQDWVLSNPSKSWEGAWVIRAAASVRDPDDLTSSMVLDHDPGTNLAHLIEFQTGNSNQAWYFHDAGDGWYWIINGTGNGCLTATGPDETLSVESCDGAAGQKWKPQVKTAQTNGGINYPRLPINR